MSPNNNQLHGFALVGTLVLTGLLFGGTLYYSEISKTSSEPLLKEDRMVIEASLAMKADKVRQPQKVVKPPDPPPPPKEEIKPPDEPPPPVPEKPVGVSRDETKKPPPEKKPEPKAEPKKPDPKKPEKLPDISSFKRPVDDDAPPGKPVTTIGQFDGSKKGFAAFNSGHPYWANLKAEMISRWEIPQISKVSGAPEACMQIDASGKILNIKFKSSGDQIMDDSVERAVKGAQKAWNQKPEPVPTEQLHVIAEFVCLRFQE